MRLIVLGDGKTYGELAGSKVIVLEDREYDDLDAVVEAAFEDERTADGYVTAVFGPEPEKVTWDAVRTALGAVGFKIYMERSGFGPWAQIEAADGKRFELTIKKGL